MEDDKSYCSLIYVSDDKKAIPSDILHPDLQSRLYSLNVYKPYDSLYEIKVNDYVVLDWNGNGEIDDLRYGVISEIKSDRIMLCNQYGSNSSAVSFKIHPNAKIYKLIATSDRTLPNIKELSRLSSGFIENFASYSVEKMEVDENLNLSKKYVIGLDEYHQDMEILLNKLPKEGDDSDILFFDCIVCLKRSGFILGAYLSNKGHCPLFTASEIENIPKKFRKILIVDDKIYSGKSMNKVRNKLTKILEKSKDKYILHSSVLYIEGDKNLTNYYVKDVNGSKTMWYEK